MDCLTCGKCSCGYASKGAALEKPVQEWTNDVRKWLELQRFEQYYNNFALRWQPIADRRTIEKNAFPTILRLLKLHGTTFKIEFAHKVLTLLSPTLKENEDFFRLSPSI